MILTVALIILYLSYLNPNDQMLWALWGVGALEAIAFILRHDK
jgi:hypothetical protein